MRLLIIKEEKGNISVYSQQLVEELRGLRQDLREFRTDLRSTHRVAVQVSRQTGDIADCVEDLAKFFVPYQREEVENSGNTGEMEDNEEETLQ